MRLFEINEAIPVGNAPDHTKLAEFVKANCQPWLKNFDSYKHRWYVFRGTNCYSSDATKILNYDPYTAFIRPIKSDRRPRDSSPEKHRIFNMLIDLVGGVANRSNSAFVTSNGDQARAFGELYVCIPIGDFNYTWSPYWSDWTANISSVPLVTLFKPECIPDELHRRAGADLKNFLYDTQEYDSWIKDNITKPENYDIELLKQYIKVDERLDDAVQSGKEIMLKANSALYMQFLTFTHMFKLL